MELKIIACEHNRFPMQGLLIRGSSITKWVVEIQKLSVALTDVNVYPIPDKIPNHLWGCLLVFDEPVAKHQAGKHELCQRISTHLFIAERATLKPSLTEADLTRLFQSDVHIAHPDFGFVTLSEAINFENLLSDIVPTPMTVRQPAPSVFIPKYMRTFQVRAIAPDQALERLSEQDFVRHQQFKDKPLSFLEKLKLGIYRLLLTKKQDASGSLQNDQASNARPSWFESAVRKLFGPGADAMERDFEDLEKRNRKQVDKLMDLFKRDPEEALKYAIPLDNDGSARGGNMSLLNFSKRWLSLSLFENLRGGASGSGVIDSQSHYDLRSQYTATAEDFLRRKQYQKAAFVYLKLLKNYNLAAQALEDGKFYQEAASVHLKHTDNIQKAAECYEKGSMTSDALKLYKELNQHEKVGDLYTILVNHKEAMIHYQLVIDKYKSNKQFIKASLLYKNKMNDSAAGQSSLLEGWRSNNDAVNCLTHYFSDFDDITMLSTSINEIYKHDVSPANREMFLKVMKLEYRKKNKLQDRIQDIAYEIISAQVDRNPWLITELKDFNPHNKELIKDTLRFKHKRR